MKTLHGIIASQGIAIGPACHFQKAELRVERLKVKEPAKEWERFGDALGKARQELEVVYAHALAETSAEAAAIFQAHAMMLEDPELLEVIQTKIEGDHLNAEAALTDATEVYARMLEALEDVYLRARAADIRDLSARVLRILLGVVESPTRPLKMPSIILAKDLTPSDTISLDN
jgi:phosphotransferase system enzyme I (PtsI)